MRIGIVGAENSHTVAVAKTLNIDKACGEARVVCVWGETEAFAKDAAERGQIPEIVQKPEDMIGKIDGVMLDHRHAMYHVPATIPFIKARIPAFTDKPFSFTLREGWKLIQLARRKKVAITSFSTIPLQAGFREDLLKQIQAAGQITSVYSSGPCDLNSQWGGIFFYGIHQVDLILKAFGTGIETVQILRAGEGNPNAMAVMTYRNGGPIVTMECISKGKSAFFIRASGLEGQVQYQYKNDPNPYLTGVQTFVEMFRTGKEPFTAAQILEPIAVLEALQKSAKTGRKVPVAKLPC